MKKIAILCISHLCFAVAGFVLGIYLLPILTAPDAPTEKQVTDISGEALYQGEFTRELSGSDFLHWGEGEVSISAARIGFTGSLAPGPDYQLYLTRELVLDEDAFLAVKNNAARIGPVKTFENFILDVPAGIDVTEYGAVVVWCETFSEFITAAKYR